jgi:hypothetical protein
VHWFITLDFWVVILGMVTKYIKPSNRGTTGQGRDDDGAEIAVVAMILGRKRRRWEVQHLVTRHTSVTSEGAHKILRPNLQLR